MPRSSASSGRTQEGNGTPSRRSAALPKTRISAVAQDTPSPVPTRATQNATDRPVSATQSQANPADRVTTERGPSGQTVTFRHDFRGGVDRQFFAVMDKVEPGDDGFRLAKKPDGRYETVGVLQSAPIPAEKPFQSVGAHWLEQMPEGTGITVDVSTSSDGQHWTEWQHSHTEPGEDHVEPFFPDGRPNPNYGETIGDLDSRTDNYGRYIRYRITMTTEKGEATPLMQRIALTYMDTTAADTTIVPEEEPMK